MRHLTQILLFGVRQIGNVFRQKFSATFEGIIVNFIPEPRKSNDIAPFTLDTFESTRMSPFFGKSFHGMVLTEEVVCAFFYPFLVIAPRNFTAKEVMCAFFNAFFGRAPRNFTIKEVMCAIRYSVFVSAPLKFTTKEVMRAFFNAFFGNAPLGSDACLLQRVFWHPPRRLCEPSATRLRLLLRNF